MAVNVLIVGSGGREHALAKKLSESSRLGKLEVAPGNAGTSQLANNINLAATDTEGIIKHAKQNDSFIVVGPDKPLANGLVDACQAEGLRVFGPTQKAAEIEWSKAWAKELMRRANIPTASYQVFDRFHRAQRYIWEHGAPVVIKASGLAAGKGAHTCWTISEADQVLRQMMVLGEYGESGRQVVIEEFLDGPEVSVHVLSDGQHHQLWPLAQDHKRLTDNPKSPNTGGLGTIAPWPATNSQLVEQIDEQVVRPALSALAAQGRPFSGCLFPGLKLTPQGPQVLEFNARFGDPETQVFMRLLKTDLLDLLEACVDGCLDQVPVEWHSGFAACVVLASAGYPGAPGYPRLPISGLDKAEAIPGVVVFQAGTEFDSGCLRTAGGRVLGVTAVGRSLEQALTNAYWAAGLIHFDGMYYRRDIGKEALSLGL